MLEFGCTLPQDISDYKSIERVAKEAEKLGFNSIWLYDHFYPYDGPRGAPCYEIWTTLSALATATSRVRLGSLVLCNSFRYPSVVAKMTSTLDNISNGRIEVGIGAGWFKEEFEGYGIPFTDAATRIASLREGIQIIKKMWTEEEVTFKGKYYHVESVFNNPKPIQKPHPPIWVGGSLASVMRVAAELADGWNIGFYPSNTPTGFRRKVKALDRYCKELGRNPAQLRRSWHGEVLLGETSSDVERQIKEFKPTNMTLDQYKVSRIIGTTDECVKQIQSYAKEGASYFMVKLPRVETIEPLKSFVEQVMVRLR